MTRLVHPLLLAALLLPAAAHARNSLVTSLPGLSPAEVAALAGAKVKDTRRLYQKTRAPARRLRKLAAKTGIDRARVSELAGLADLCRRSGVTPRIARLLQLADAGSLGRLARQEADALLARATTINDTQRVTEHPPTRAQLAGWIKDAKRLKPEDWEQLRAWASVR